MAVLLSDNSVFMPGLLFQGTPIILLLGYFIIINALVSDGFNKFLTFSLCIHYYYFEFLHHSFNLVLVLILTMSVSNVFITSSVVCIIFQSISLALNFLSSSKL